MSTGVGLGPVTRFRSVELAIAWFAAAVVLLGAVLWADHSASIEMTDFSVTYKTHTRFDVEVTRLRGAQAGAAPEPGKLINTLCVKLKQLPPSMINILVLAADDAPYSGDGPSTSPGRTGQPQGSGSGERA